MDGAQTARNLLRACIGTMLVRQPTLRGQRSHLLRMEFAKLLRPAVSMSFYRTAEAIAAELAARWKSAFEPKSWTERLDLLHQVHEQLKEDLRDIELYCAVSPLLVREVIDLLSGGPVASLAQAHVYANSGDPEHRRAAGEWLATSIQPVDSVT